MTNFTVLGCEFEADILDDEIVLSSIRTIEDDDFLFMFKPIYQKQIEKAALEKAKLDFKEQKDEAAIERYQSRIEHWGI